MSKAYKVAGQAAPAANTDTALYVVPASKYFVSSTLSIVNRDKTGDAAEFRVAVVPSGETLDNKHYLEFDRFLDQRESHRMTLGFSLPAGCTVYVRSTTANLSFTLFGVESDVAS